MTTKSLQQNHSSSNHEFTKAYTHSHTTSHIPFALFSSMIHNLSSQTHVMPIINSLEFSTFKKSCWENFPESARRHRRALFRQRRQQLRHFLLLRCAFSLSLSRSVGFVHYPRSVKSSSSSSSSSSTRSFFSSVSLTLFPFTSSARPDQLSSFFWRSFDTRNRLHQKLTKVQGFQPPPPPPPHLTGKLTSARSELLLRL